MTATVRIETEPRTIADRSPTQRRPAVASRRIVALDATRGMLLVASILMISWRNPRPDQFVHAEWWGVTAIDVIFPLFVTLSGAALAIAYRNGVPWTTTARRVVVLLAAGLVYNMVLTDTIDPGSLRLTGPLQIYAVLVLVIGVTHIWVRSARGWMVLTAAFAAGQSLLFHVWQNRCSGELTPECNPSLSIDQALFDPSHLYAAGARGHDPEGVVTALGALVTASAALVGGKLMVAHRRTGKVTTMLLGWAAVVALAALLAWLYAPAMKRLWSPPYALAVAAFGLVILAVGYWLFDKARSRQVMRVSGGATWPLVALGRNSLLVYFGAHAVLHTLDGNGSPSWSRQVADSLAWIPGTSTGFAVASVLAWVAVASVLHRRRIYVRA